MRILGYMSGSADSIEQQRAMLLQYGVQEDNIFADVLSKKGAEQRALNTMLGTPETLSYLHAGDLLVIPEISSLGRNFNLTFEKWRRLREELNVTIIILPRPLAALDATDPMTSSETPKHYSLSEFLDKMMYMYIELKKKQAPPRKAGRPSIPYPANWDEVYHAWKLRDISSADAMNKTGLKRNTFYKMIKKYESQISDEK